MTYTLVTDNRDTEQSTSFATLTEALAAWREAAKRVGPRESDLYSVSVRSDEGKRLYHVEDEDADD